MESTGLPGSGRSEEDAVPVFIEDALAIVVPHGVQHAFRAEPLAVAHKVLDIDEANVAVRIDAAPVVDAGGDPDLHTGAVEGLNVFVEVGFRVVDPGNADHVFGQGGDEIRVVPGEVAPEEYALAGGLDDAVDLSQKIDVDLIESSLGDEILGLALAQFVGFVGADMHPGRRELLGDLGKPLLDQRERAGLHRREDLAVRRFAKR